MYRTAIASGRLCALCDLCVQLGRQVGLALPLDQRHTEHHQGSTKQPQAADRMFGKSHPAKVIEYRATQASVRRRRRR